MKWFPFEWRTLTVHSSQVFDFLPLLELAIVGNHLFLRTLQAATLWKISSSAFSKDPCFVWEPLIEKMT